MSIITMLMATESKNDNHNAIIIKIITIVVMNNQDFNNNKSINK